MDVLWDGIEGIMVRWLGRIDTTGVLHDWILLSGVKLNAYPHTGQSAAVTLLMRSPRSRIRPWSTPPCGTCWVRSLYTSSPGK